MHYMHICALYIVTPTHQPKTLFCPLGGAVAPVENACPILNDIPAHLSYLKRQKKKKMCERKGQLWKVARESKVNKG